MAFTQEFKNGFLLAASPTMNDAAKLVIMVTASVTIRFIFLLMR